MLKLKWLPGVIAAATLGGIALPSISAVELYVDVAPPPPRVEVVPAPRAGFVWAPGFWAWREGRHVWMRGHWERERHGMYWHPGHWVEREGRWYFESPRWHTERFSYGYGRGYAWGDRDRDGVPNIYDRAPDNPYRY